MSDWIDRIEARNKAQAKYDKKNTVGFYMKLNLHSDADIIRWLHMQPSKQAAVKELIRNKINEFP
ncbi:MAG: hypothetical protein OSJ71_17715 [Acetatifactor sp.]|nr:hypothetical protein [Acetatifactor sp.]